MNLPESIKRKLVSAEEAVSIITPEENVSVGTACATPRVLIVADLCTTSDSFQLYSPNNSPVKKQLFKANILILLYKYLDKQLRFRHNSFK